MYFANYRRRRLPLPDRRPGPPRAGRAAAADRLGPRLRALARPAFARAGRPPIRASRGARDDAARPEPLMATPHRHLVARHPGPGPRPRRPPVEQGRAPPALPGRDRQGRQSRRQARLQRLHRGVAQGRPRPAATTSRPRSTAEVDRLETEYDKHRLAELIQSRRRRGRPGAPPAHDETPKRRATRAHRDATTPTRRPSDTVVGSATRDVVIGDDRPFVDHRRADQPDRPEAPRGGDEGRRLQPGRARHARPGRGRRPHARRQRRDPARGRAGDPRRGRSSSSSRLTDLPLLDRLLDRRGARGRPRRLPGQGRS